MLALMPSISQRNRSTPRSAAAAINRWNSSEPRPWPWHPSSTATAASATPGSPSIWMKRATPRPSPAGVTAPIAKWRTPSISVR